jgi:hypothetical protein
MSDKQLKYTMPLRRSTRDRRPSAAVNEDVYECADRHVYDAAAPSTQPPVPTGSTAAEPAVDVPNWNDAAAKQDLPAMEPAVDTSLLFADADVDVPMHAANNGDGDIVSTNVSTKAGGRGRGGKGVVYALAEDSQWHGEGGERHLSLHASKNSAARAMRALFDRGSGAFNTIYDIVMGDKGLPASAAGEPLLQFEDNPDFFECIVNDDGNPVHLFFNSKEGTETLSINEKTIGGPLGFYFDRNLVADIIISTTGVTRVLADVIADYTIPAVYLFEHTVSGADGNFSDEIWSSSLLAAPGGAAPSKEFAKTYIANAVRQSSEMRHYVGRKMFGRWCARSCARPRMRSSQSLTTWAYAT